MTHDEARAHIGYLVVYRAPRSRRPGEEGVITSVNDSYVFVRYGTQQTSQATPAAYLTAVSGPVGT